MSGLGLSEVQVLEDSDVESAEDVPSEQDHDSDSDDFDALEGLTGRPPR